MKVWSKGLGKMELILDFENYRVEREAAEDGENFYIKGVITDPVFWEFRITMTKDDIPGLLHIATNRKLLFMFIKNIRQVLRFFAGRLRPSRPDKTEENKNQERP